jgi:phenylpropionate dioxygenase-like ring-hydroxylating dioxygenase large terminal subunit
VQVEGSTPLFDFFYPVAQSRLLRTKPLLRTLGEVPMALFRDASGQARALHAGCPHRGANLADGEVVGGCLACPYHGWRFSGEGRCVKVPSHPERAIPSRSHAQSYEVVEQQGVIWVRLGNPARPAVALPPRFAIAEDPAFRAFVIEDSYPGPADWWLENFMDISHVPFVHRRTFGGQRTEVTPGPVERSPELLSFRASVQVRYGYGLLARLLHGAVRSYTEEVFFHVSVPATIHLINEMGHGKRQAIAFLASPEGQGRTRIILTIWRNYLTWLPFADLIGERFTRAVLAEDSGIVERSIAPQPVAERAVMAADGAIQELLRLQTIWRERAVGNPSQESLAHVD